MLRLEEKESIPVQSTLPQQVGGFDEDQEAQGEDGMNWPGDFVDQVICGDAIKTMWQIPEGVIQCCVTSPPFWGLRDYGVDGQYGLESTPEEYVAKVVEVFREVRRLLRDDGTLFLNLGDSYAGSGRGRDADGTWNPGKGGSKQATNVGSTIGRQVNSKSLSKNLIEQGAIGNAWVKPPQGFKPKDRIGIPHMVVFALRADGWWWRDEIVWKKPNPMPESVTDRCTKAHEFVFMLSKSATYYYDQDAIKEPLTESSIARLSQDVEHQAGSDRVPGKSNGPMKAVSHKGSTFHKGKTAIHQANRASERPRFDHNGRNRRSVWTIATQPSGLPHFAQFPEKLVEPPIMAGSKAGDIVLDPFGGLGTVGLVAKRHGRLYISIDLSSEYSEIAIDRLRQKELF